MSGQAVFEQLVAFADAEGAVHQAVSFDDYEQWKRDFIWEALHGIRYGQSFCNRFNIHDNLLYYNTWPPDQQDDYIRKNYLARA